MHNNFGSRFILLNAGFAKLDSDWNWKDVSSPFARLYMVAEGGATVHLPDGTFDLKPGFLYLIPPFTPHRYENDGHFSHYYFHIYENLSFQTRILEEYSFPFEIPSNELSNSLIYRLLRINPGMELQKYDPLSYDNTQTIIKNLTLSKEVLPSVLLETNGILCLLISSFLELSSKRYDVTDNRINKALAYVRENIDEDIKPCDLAERSYLSKNHFARLFKDETGVTPSAYINARKIEKAQLLLISTDMPVKNIARQLSFNNLSNFNRLFRQISGTTPKEYRESFN